MGILPNNNHTKWKHNNQLPSEIGKLQKQQRQHEIDNLQHNTHNIWDHDKTKQRPYEIGE